MPKVERSRPQSLWVAADDGVRLRVEAWPASDADAPLVLGLHGITANRLAFLPLLEELAGEVTFVSYDARGRGLSDKPEDASAYGHRRHAEDAVAVLTHLGRRADVVLGQSMGAWDGLQLAAHHPELVGALVLGDGGYFADLPASVTPREHVDAVMGAGWLERLQAVAPSRDLVLGLLSQTPPFRELWGPAMEALFEAGLEELPDGSVRNRCSPVAALTDALDYFVTGDSALGDSGPGGQPYVRADLPLVTCSVHLVRAPRGFDTSPETTAPVLPESTVEEFEQALPQLVVETVPDTNHFSVNFGRAGVTALAEATRKALR